MLYYLMLLTAVFMVGLELFTSLRNQTTFFNDSAGKAWNLMYRWRWLVGVPFAVLPAVVSYPIEGADGAYQITGFPLVLEAVDEQGISYPSQMLTPFLAVNVAIWYFVPHIVLYLWSLVARLGRGAKSRHRG